jgi:hypothetical protein
VTVESVLREYVRIVFADVAQAYDDDGTLLAKDLCQILYANLVS